MRNIFALLIALGLSGCGTKVEIPLSISTSRNSDGSVSIRYKNSSKRYICVSKESLTVDSLSEFPGKRKEGKVFLSKMDRKFLDFQYFSNRNLAEVEIWRGSGVTTTNAVQENEKFELLLQAVYCDDIISNKKNVDAFEYFQKF